MADHTDGTNDIFESAFEDIASRLGAFEWHLSLLKILL
jgi:hypothetical protein